MRIGRRRGWSLVALGAFLLVGALDLGGILAPLSNAAADARARLLRHEVSSDIVIVGIDAASIKTLDSWPWPRSHHAKLIARLRESAPRSVFMDIDFSSASGELGDAMFDEALARRREFPIVLPTFFQYASGADSELLVSRPLPRFARSVDFAAVNAEPPGSDGLTRTWPNRWTIENETFPTVIDPRGQLTGEQSVTIDYSISPASFTYVSYVDVYAGRVPRETFAGKQVFVGATALELGDMMAVPVYG